MTDQNKTDGRYRILQSGAVLDTTSGKFVANPGGGKYAITPETSQQMHARKRELVQRHAAEAIDEAAIEEGQIPQNAPPGTGWKGVVKKVTQTLFKSENLRGQAEAARFLGQAAGYYNTPEGKDESEFEQLRGLIRDLAELSREINRAQAKQTTNGDALANAHEVIEIEAE
jgi:hypothetical protein